MGFETYIKMVPMTPHEKECALAALAVLCERKPRDKELRQWYREMLASPIKDERN